MVDDQADERATGPAGIVPAGIALAHTRGVGSRHVGRSAERVA